MPAMLTYAQVAALYDGDPLRDAIAVQLLEEPPDSFSEAGARLYDEARVRAYVASRLPAGKVFPSVLIPAATAAEDKATLNLAGIAKIAARRGIAENAVAAELVEYTDPTAEGTGNWWHVRGACFMFGGQIIPADSYVFSRSFVEMRDGGHTLLS